jgi:hypothetical protein
MSRKRNQELDPPKEMEEDNFVGFHCLYNLFLP